MWQYSIYKKVLHFLTENLSFLEFLWIFKEVKSKTKNSHSIGESFVGFLTSQHNFTSPQLKQKLSWPPKGQKLYGSFFIDRVQLSPGCKATTRKQTVYFLPLSPQKFLVLIWSDSEGWKTESTLQPSNGLEFGTPGLRIQHLNH